jgi:hypothetical protein
MTSRFTQLITRWITMSLAGLAGWMGAEADTATIDDLGGALAVALMAVIGWAIDLMIHRALKRKEAAPPPAAPRPIRTDIPLLLVAALSFLAGCAGRSTIEVPGGGQASTIGAPSNAFSETHDDGTVETAVGPVITSRTRVKDDEYVTHGPGQASSIIISLFVKRPDGTQEEIPIEFDVQTVANWRAESIAYNPDTGAFDVRGMEVSASAIIDAANAIYPEITRMVEAGTLTEQQAWQLISSVLQTAIETAGDVLAPVPDLD